MKELGYDVDFNIWCGLLAPAGTPAAVMQKLRDAMRQVSTDATFRTMMERISTPIDYRDAPEFQKLYDSDAKRLAETVKRIGRLEMTK